jgi:hypothetical protein
MKSGREFGRGLTPRFDRRHRKSRSHSLKSEDLPSGRKLSMPTNPKNSFNQDFFNVTLMTSPGNRRDFGE